MKNSAPVDLAVDAPERKRLPPLLRRCWYGMNQAFRRRILHTGVTPDQFTVLRTLMEAEERGMTQRQIAEKMSSDPNTVASLLERMKSSGLVERQPHESDKRAHRIRLLPHGRKTYRTIRSIALKLQSDILASIPAEQRDQFLEQLEKVAEACRKAAEESPRSGE
jgi:DNA-binding MarR family transcriptional regulator